VIHHHADAQRVDPLRGHGQGYEGAAALGHEGEMLGPGELGGHDQVALILAVGLVHQHDEAAGAKRLDGGVNRGWNVVQWS
jgi:hypothetical protein